MDMNQFPPICCLCYAELTADERQAQGLSRPWPLAGGPCTACEKKTARFVRPIQQERGVYQTRIGPPFKSKKGEDQLETKPTIAS